MQKLITEVSPLINKEGIATVGYSTKSILKYDRRDIKAAPWRIKEWDFYQISDAHKCMQLTIGHASYAGNVSMMLFEFDQKKERIERTKTLVMPFDRLKMPNDAEKDGVLQYSSKTIDVRFETVSDRRILSCKADDFYGELILTRKNPNSLVITVPFDSNKHEFYYNQKINCMTAEGKIHACGKDYNFSSDDSFGLLDWGRGVWPFSHQWYWSNGTGLVEGEIFGFNLGCGFGDTSMADENMLFFEGKAHKLEGVKFDLSGEYSNPWHIYDENGRLDLIFTPFYDRYTSTKLLFFDNRCHQMFGTFNGIAILDDGRKLEIKDLVSFAEHAVNNW